MTIVITQAEERAAAYFRDQCEIVWWRLHAVARDDRLNFDILLKPCRQPDYALGRDAAALMASGASGAGASREAIACILSTNAPEVGQMIARARHRRHVPQAVSPRAAIGGRR